MSDFLKNGNTYVFSEEGEPISTISEVKKKIWQISPSCIGALMCIPFGIMLGWPSPTYPKLIPSFSPNSPINITIDQSAMIAGFLMIGNTLGTPLSSISPFGSKYGITLGLSFMLVGWIVMRFAYSLHFLLGSRLLTGLGFGYGVGQLKLYVKDISQPPYSSILTKLIMFYVFFGVIVAYTLGCFTSFINFSTVAAIITTVILVVCLFIPHSPQEYVLMGKKRQAGIVLQKIKPTLNANYEMECLERQLDLPDESMSFLQVWRERSMRKFVIIIAILTFVQQFTGAPATIVYAQIIFIKSNCSHPEISAIAYGVVFFISNFIGTFYMDTFNKKACLLFSSVSVSLALVLNITVFYFNMNGSYWNYTSLIAMFLYIFVHSSGLAVIPFMLTPEYFSPKAVGVISKFQIMLHSIFALVITKIFQVLLDVYTLYVPFCLFLCVSVLSSVLIWFVVPFDVSVLQQSITLLEKPPQVL